MFDLNVGDWVKPKKGLLPIDPEGEKPKRETRQITTNDSLQIASIDASTEGNEKVTFTGLKGSFLAAFFEPTAATADTDSGILAHWE